MKAQPERPALRRAFLLCAALALLALLAAPAGIADQSEIPNKRTSVTLKRSGNALTARVTLNGEVRANFIVDTGATDTMLSPRIARRLGIGEDEGHPVTFTLANGKQVEGRIIPLEELKVGQARVTQTHAAVLDRFRKTGFDGLLGMSFLENFVFKIDYEQSKLVLYER